MDPLPTAPDNLEAAFKRFHASTASDDLMVLFDLLKSTHRVNQGLDIMRSWLCRVDLQSAPDVIGRIARYFTVLGAPQEAITLFDQIINPARENHRAWFENKAFAHLVLDDFATGHALWQKAWSQSPFDDVVPSTANTSDHGWSTWSRIPHARYLDSRVDVRGKSVRLVLDGGIGDAIQNLRYIDHLHREGTSRVGMDILAPLASLVTHSGFNLPNTLGQPLDSIDYDYYALHSSLFLRYEDGSPSKATFPYLTPGPANQHIKPVIDFIRQTGSNKLKVAVCWRSVHTRHHCEPYRSMPIRDLLPLFKLPGVQFYSCTHRGISAEEAYYLRRYKVPHFGGEIQNLNDLACIFKEMDIVISVDSAPLHLAGAMNISAYALISTMSEWRWGLASNRSFLYPSLRLFRQQTLDDWGSPVAEIAAQLTRLVNQRALNQVRHRRSNKR